MFDQKFWKVLAVVFVAVTTINSLMGIVSHFDRRQLNALVEARQKIGLILIRAGERENVFTAEEKRRICEVWADARYSATGEECPE